MLCPVNDLCVAKREGAPENYPVKTRKLKRTSQSLWLLRARGPHSAIWLEKRPPTGVWAGLYCLPVFDSHAALQQAVPQCAALHDDPVFMHVLTHKDLHLHPVTGDFEAVALAGRDGAWFAAEEWPRLGLPAPIRKLLAA
jgi:A/G-specific adenine glycosylase